MEEKNMPKRTDRNSAWVRPGGRPTLPIESWLAGLSSMSERNRYLEAYLSCIDEQYVTSEHAMMLNLITTARPSRPLTPPLIVERRVETIVELPVFDFDVPDVPGAAVSIQLIRAQAVASNQNFSAGFGGESGETYSVSIEATFTAEAGEAKRIFKSVPAVANRRYDVGPSSDAHPIRMTSEDACITGGEGISSLGFRLLRRQPPTYVHVPFQNSKIDISNPNLFPESSSSIMSFELKDHPATGVTKGKYREELSRRYVVRAGGTALGLDVSANLSMTFTGTLVLELVLPNGHDYQLRRLESRPGITWQVDGRPMPRWVS
jgi:hypothetical protein